MFFKKDKLKRLIIFSPCDGKIVNLENVNDEVFSTKILGNGIAIVPKTKDFYAPTSGKITVLFPTGHAFGIHNSEFDIDILVHIGLETSSSKTKLYDIHQKINNIVTEKNDIIVSADLKAIRNAKFDDITPIIVTSDSLEKHKNVQIKLLASNGKIVKKGEELFSVIFK